MEVVLPLCIFGVIGTLILMGCMSSFDAKERRWLVPTILLGYALRMAAATMFAAIPATRIFHEDAGGYEYVGMGIAAGWSGKGPPYPMGVMGNSGFYYVSAGVYYIFGLFPVNVPYFNGIIGCVTALFIYGLARWFFHVRVARLATMLVLFTPSMILWSAIALKDAFMTFLIVVAVTSCVALKRRVSLLAIVGLLAPLMAMQPIRFYMIYFVGFAALTSMVFDRGIRAFTGIYKQLFMGAVAFGLLAALGLLGSVQGGTDYLSFERANSFRYGMAVSAQSGFSANVDISTPMGALKFLPIGIATLLLAPFPWQMTSLRALIAAPETIAWWILFPSVIRAARFVIRHRFKEASPLLIFAVTLTCAYSLVHGNVGSGFRQRAQIFVFLFIFAAVGWFQKKCRRAGIDERHLLNHMDDAPAEANPQRSAA